MTNRAHAYFATLSGLLSGVRVSDADGAPVALDGFLGTLGRWAREAHETGNAILFIGNGGSATIASHMAIDFTKNGGLRAVAFNDAAALICLGNDLGYDQVFAKQIDMHARRGDVLVAISSSGRSPNIMAGVAAARGRDCRVVTLSGFDANNPLRRSGDLNAYVASSEYGFVEIAHLGLCHAALDLAMGWGSRSGADGRSIAQGVAL